MTTTNRRRRAWRMKILLVFLSLLFALLVAEPFLRAIKLDLNASHIWQYDPVFGWTADPENATDDHVNRNGFRYISWSNEKREPPQKVFALGDSFTHACGIPYALTYPAHLEQALNAQFSDRQWAVLNFGIGDWGPGQQLIALQKFRAEHEPDLVILQFFPFNDLPNCAVSMAGTASMQDHHRPYWIEGSDGLQIAYLHPIRTRLRNSLLVFGLFENMFTPHWKLLPRREIPYEEVRVARNKYFAENSNRLGLSEPGALYSLVTDDHQPPAVREAWTITERVVTRLVEVASEGDTPVIAFVIPYHNTLGRVWDDFKAPIRTPLKRDYCTARFESLLESLDVPTVSIRKKIEASGIGPSWFFLEDGHFNVLGHRQINDWLLEEISSTTEIQVIDPAERERSITMDFVNETVEAALTGLDRASPRQREPYLAAHGPLATVKFISGEAMQAQLDLQAYSLVPQQSVEVIVNGISLKQLTELPANVASENWVIPIEISRGPNEIRLKFADWNHGSKAYFPKDRRPLAANLLRFAIVALGEGSEQSVDERCGTGGTKYN